MKTLINNFCGSKPIEVSASIHPDPAIGALVDIMQSGGSMRFQHSMKPEQAREMAKALIAAADFLDAAQAIKYATEVAE